MSFETRNLWWCVTNVRHVYRVRKAMRLFKATHGSCAWCGRTKGIHVHHVLPVKTHPWLADDGERNMISLCGKRCHLTLGHLGNWRTSNQAVVRTCKTQVLIK